MQSMISEEKQAASQSHGSRTARNSLSRQKNTNNLSLATPDSFLNHDINSYPMGDSTSLITSSKPPLVRKDVTPDDILKRLNREKSFNKLMTDLSGVLVPQSPTQMKRDDNTMLDNRVTLILPVTSRRVLQNTASNLFLSPTLYHFLIIPRPHLLPIHLKLTSRTLYDPLSLLPIKITSLLGPISALLTLSHTIPLTITIKMQLTHDNAVEA
mmetsp:Transcript_8497/g.12670  ORF Transcript_8497/g.12670 Transcript_8497/m.12670 type:complete len:212 (+) Transcript_8497:332-967(+)